MTAPHKLQPAQSPSPSRCYREEDTGPAFEGRLAAAFSAASDADDQTSDAPCRAPRFLGETPSSHEEPGPLPPPLRQQWRISRPEAPSLDKCAAHFRRQHPPPISRLCRRDPASGALSPLRCSRTKRLDPQRLRGLFARGREDHAPLVDFCNRYDQRAQPPDRPNPAHRAWSRPQTQLQTSP